MAPATVEVAVRCAPKLSTMCVALVVLVGAGSLNACTEDGPASFDEMPLPPLAEPLELTAESQRGQAAQLSEALLSTGKSSEAALHAAVRVLRLSVSNHDGKLLRSDFSTSGPPVAAWQIQMMAKTGSIRQAIRLSTFGQMIAALPGFDGAPVEQMLRKDLDAAEGRASLPALLLTGHGEMAGVSGTAAPASEFVSIPRAWLILRALSAQLLTLSSAQANLDSGTEHSSPPAGPSGDAQPSVERDAQVDFGPCRFTPVQRDINDVASTVLAGLFQEVLDYAQKTSPSDIIGRQKHILDLTNSVSALADGLMAYASLRPSIDVAPQPLKRTREEWPRGGGTATAQATLAYAIPYGATGVNCMQLAMSTVGG